MIFLFVITMSIPISSLLYDNYLFMLMTKNKTMGIMKTTTTKTTKVMYNFNDIHKKIKTL